jgi:Zn-dependent protease
VAEKTLIVKGSGIDAVEGALLAGAATQYPFLKNASIVSDSNSAMEQLESGRFALVVLLGGPYQNNLTGRVLSSGMLNESEELYGQLQVKYGRTPKGTLVLLVSDKRGFRDEQRASLEYSPLAAFLPPEYIPAGATLISILGLLLINLGRTVFEFKALGIGRKGKKIGEAKIMAFGRNIAEPAALVGASIVLGVSISWQYFGMGPEFAKWVLINTVICFLAGIAHELTHRLLAHAFKIKVEYRFWPSGSALTLISSYLGNAFSVQGFLLEEIPQNVAKWKVGIMKLAAPLLSTAIMLVFAYYNSLHPDKIYEAIYTISALWAMAEMLPFSGLDGKDIKEWNSTVWLASFVLVGACYAYVTFIL